MPKGTATSNRHVVKCGIRITANERQSKQHTLTNKERQRESKATKGKEREKYKRFA